MFCRTRIGTGTERRQDPVLDQIVGARHLLVGTVMAMPTDQCL